MGDPDGARGILEEVIEEGNNDQKTEAESLIAQLA
jgi:pilus assembly protein FimV